MPPAVHHFGPVAGPVVKGESLRRADQLAIHHPRRRRVDSARHRRAPTSSSRSSPSSTWPSKIVTRAAATRPITTAGSTPRRPPPDRQRQLRARPIDVAAHDTLVGANDRDHGVGGGLAMPLQQPLGGRSHPRTGAISPVSIIRYIAVIAAALAAPMSSPAATRASAGLPTQKPTPRNLRSRMPPGLGVRDPRRPSLRIRRRRAGRVRTANLLVRAPPRPSSGSRHSSA